MTFSSRLNWNACANSISVALRELRASGRPILDLTESNPTRAGLPYGNRQILAALAKPESLIYEPSPAGLQGARQAVAEYYSLRGCDVPPERILLTASTSEAYAYLFKLLADPGDEILVPAPSYPLFEFLAALDSVKSVHYPLLYHDGWWTDIDALTRLITPRTRAILVVNPNNPTGSFLREPEQNELLTTCARHRLPLIIDEVFSDYSFTGTHRTIMSDNHLVFHLNGLSKILGMPQMKLGWIVVSGPPGLSRETCTHLELIADTYLSVSAPIQYAVPDWLRFREPFQASLQRRLETNLEFVESATEGSACALLKVEGGWYATLRLPRTRTEEEWALSFLREDGVLVQPGFFYDFPSEAYAVTSLLTKPETYQTGISRILRAVSRE